MASIHTTIASRISLEILVIIARHLLISLTHHVLDSSRCPSLALWLHTELWGWALLATQTRTAVTTGQMLRTSFVTGQSGEGTRTDCSSRQTD